jgi:DNA adenine methylase
MLNFQVDSTTAEYTKQDSSAEPIQRPPLKWAGGKRWQLPRILPYWQPKRYRRLVEPFCGGLAIALGLSPDVAMLNDINPHLINFYRQLKLGFVSNLICQNDEAFYYEQREEFNRLIKAGKTESHEAAELFYYLNRTGYNGLCRFNQSGEFNVPFGRYKKITYRHDFREDAKTFANWEFTNAHFQQFILHEHDFVYADPPYDVQFRQYSEGGFGWHEQVALAHWLQKHHGPVILVNQATDRIIELYGQLGYQLTYLQAPRRISCNGDRTPAPEVLAVRNLP